MILKRFKHCYICSDRVQIFCKLHSVEIYWPLIVRSKIQKAIFFQTAIVYSNRKSWDYICAGVIRFFGFGFGYAYNHCENPNYVADLYKKYEKENPIEDH